MKAAGQRRKTVWINKLDCLQLMTEDELSKVLLTMLPVNKIDPNPTEDRCKYQIGTQAFSLIIRANKIMVRVGGGFATLEEHIKQIILE